MKRLVVGVIGHVDHGKTALVRALTGMDTDRLPEEKRRGISIALGFAHLKIAPDLDVDFIDMPGHERFVRTMISGATGMDAVLLVVAANEGIKAQTCEHVDIAGTLGLRRAVIAVSKVDLVAPAEAQRVADEAAQLLTRAGFDPAPIVMTSAVKQLGIDNLRAALANLADSQSPRSAEGLAYLPIDRAFTMSGHGPVVTGTLRGARIAAGDTLEVLPSRKRAGVRSVQVHGANVDGAEPGQRVALNLRDVDIDDLKRAAALGASGAFPLSDWLTISIRAAGDAPPLKNGMRLRALLGATETSARLRLLDRDELQPGESGFAQLHCAEPVATPAREHVILRIASPARTVAGGRVLESVANRRKRNDASILQRLTKLRDLSADDIVLTEVTHAASVGTTLVQLSQLTALSPEAVVSRTAIAQFVITSSGVVVLAEALSAVVARAPALLARDKAGLSQDQLLKALPGVSDAVLGEALSRLVAQNAIIKRGANFMIPRPDEDRARAQSDADLAARIAETLRIGALAPPTPRDIIIDAPTQRAVDRLLREGVIIRAVDRDKGKEMLFHRDAIEAAQRALAPLLERVPGLLVTEIAAALGVSRKYVMPLLDHLDGIRFTQRIKDRRILGAKASSVR